MRLKVENVSFAYSGNKGDADRFIFKNVNLELDSGKILAILGPNGSGKTTFLRCLMGMLKLSSGTHTAEGLAHACGETEAVYRVERHHNDRENGHITL